jgi:response regulator RpfG family c-di-GMP phosphodiesterase
MAQQQDVLLVEDTLTQALRISHILSTKYQVKHAKSGREALDLLSTYRPALILSDINMPEMDGYQLCTRIKEIPEYSNIPFVLLIFPLDNRETTNIINCRADDLVGKIFDSEYLLGRLSEILDKRCDQSDQSDPTSQFAANDKSGENKGRQEPNAEVLRLGQLLASAIGIVSHYNRVND